MPCLTINSVFRRFYDTILRYCDSRNSGALLLTYERNQDQCLFNFRILFIQHPCITCPPRPVLTLDVSHEDPLAGLTESPCFPLKSHSAVVLLGAVRVNISVSIESVLFWRSSVFLGSSVLTQPRLGSPPMCAGPQPLHPCTNRT